METKTKVCIETVKIGQIGRSYLLNEIQKKMQGQEVFVDTDEILDEKIYYACVFDTILNEDEGLNHLSEEAKEQLLLLSGLVTECVYVQITNI